MLDVDVLGRLCLLMEQILRMEAKGPKQRWLCLTAKLPSVDEADKHSAVAIRTLETITTSVDAQHIVNYMYSTDAKFSTIQPNHGRDSFTVMHVCDVMQKLLYYCLSVCLILNYGCTVIFESSLELRQSGSKP